MAIKQEIIKLKEIQRWLNHKGFNDNEECVIKINTSSITIKIGDVSKYTGIAKCGKHSGAFCMKEWKKHKECLNCQYIKHHRKQWKTINGILHKRCPHCQKYLPLDAFNVKSDGKYDSWCKNCHKEYLKDYKRTKRYN